MEELATLDLCGRLGIRDLSLRLAVRPWQRDRGLNCGSVGTDRTCGVVTRLGMPIKGFDEDKGRVRGYRDVRLNMGDVPRIDRTRSPMEGGGHG